MTHRRSVYETPRRAAVTPLRPSLPTGILAAFLLGALMLAALMLPAPASAEEGADEVARALLTAARHDLPLAERLDAAATILGAPDGVDAAGAARAALGLLEEAPETAGWLVLKASDGGWIPDTQRDRLIKAIDAALAGETLQPHDRARLVAAGVLVGRRPADLGDALTRLWPPPDLVRAVLRRDLLGAGDATLPTERDDARALIDEQREIAALLDEATLDDPTRMRAGLDGLLAKGGAAVPLLLHEATLGAHGRPIGRMPRAVRAIVALGMLGDRRATPVLARGLRSPDGWVRVAAATALGDLGDPAGAPALAEHLTNTGDVFRSRDQWDYPGRSATTVAEGAWSTVDYFVVDVAAADALLRLGAKNAAAFIIHKELDPTAKNARIRVFQDAVDALRRAFAHTEAKPLVAAYNVDSGLPLRDKAFLDLAAWWHLHRDDEDVLALSIDESDAGFRRETRRLVDKLLGKDVRSFMITKPALELLGTAATPVLIEAIDDAERGSARAEIAKTLAMVRDPRAIPALRRLAGDTLPFVRAAAYEALGVYVADHPEALEILLAGLRESKPGPHVSALKGLVAAPVSERVQAAVAAARPDLVSSDWARAETVFHFLQTGAESWPEIEAGLAHEDRHVREAWWRLLHAALDLPEHRHDAYPKIALAKRRLDKAAALAARDARRTR